MVLNINIKITWYSFNFVIVWCITIILKNIDLLLSDTLDEKHFYMFNMSDP